MIKKNRLFVLVPKKSNKPNLQLVTEVDKPKLAKKTKKTNIPK